MRLYELWLRDSQVCHLCLQEVLLAEASRDHVIPKSRRGSNGAANIKLAHKVCNNFRAAMDLDAISVEEYRAHRLAHVEFRRPPRRPRKVEFDPWLPPSLRQSKKRQHGVHAAEPASERWRCQPCSYINRYSVVIAIFGKPYRRCSNCMAKIFV